MLWSELHQGRWGGHSEGRSSRERRYVCRLRVAKSGCMSVPVSQLPGQGAISGADASPALGGLSKYSTAAGSPDKIPPDGWARAAHWACLVSCGDALSEALARGVAAALEAGQAQVHTCLLPRPQVGLGMGMGQ